MVILGLSFKYQRLAPAHRMSAKLTPLNGRSNIASKPKRENMIRGTPMVWRS